MSHDKFWVFDILKSVSLYVCHLKPHDFDVVAHTNTEFGYLEIKFSRSDCQHKFSYSLSI